MAGFAQRDEGAGGDRALGSEQAAQSTVVHPRRIRSDWRRPVRRLGLAVKHAEQEEVIAHALVRICGGGEAAT